MTLSESLPGGRLGSDLGCCRVDLCEISCIEASSAITLMRSGLLFRPWLGTPLSKPNFVAMTTLVAGDIKNF